MLYCAQGLTYSAGIYILLFCIFIIQYVSFNGVLRLDFLQWVPVCGSHEAFEIDQSNGRETSVHDHIINHVRTHDMFKGYQLCHIRRKQPKE